MRRVDSFCAPEFETGLSGEETRAVTVELDTWLLANLVDKRVELEIARGSSQSNGAAIAAILEEYFAERLAEGDRADEEEAAYEMRRSGYPWLAVSRALHKAEEVCKALALCYCHRPVTEGRKPLRWWE